MDILRVYVLGANLQMLLQSFWDDYAVVLKVGRFHGRPFSAERGLTQGDPVSPTIFNILVDTVVKAFLMEVYGPQ